MVSSEHLPSASAELALNLTPLTSFLIRIILDEPYFGVLVSNVSARGSQDEFEMMDVRSIFVLYIRYIYAYA